MSVRTFMIYYDTESIASLVVAIDEFKKQIKALNNILVPLCDKVLEEMYE